MTLSVGQRLGQAMVRDPGLSWHNNNAMRQTYVKRAHDERIAILPHDLEIKPSSDKNEVTVLRQKECLHRRRTAHPQST